MLRQKISSYPKNTNDRQMSVLESKFRKKNKPVKSYQDFWDWFKKHESKFFRVVKGKGDIEKVFFSKLSRKLDKLQDGFFYLVGMDDENTVELVITADGAIRNIVFAEELVQAAPPLPGWKFTALKPALDIKNVLIEMAGHTFSDENLSFYANDHPDYPDEIDITIVHHDLNEANKTLITNGTYIFLDNYLGELNFATTIDSLSVIGKDEATQPLIPIEKLKPFLVWREKEFIEKYEGTRHDTENDTYAIMEAELHSGGRLLALIDTDLLKWDRKASHPWILTVEVKFDGTNSQGMPKSETMLLLDEIENEILEKLKDYKGYLYIGRQTAGSIREIYFACQDFREPSRRLYQLAQNPANKLPITFDIYKDKYWQSFKRFSVS